MWEKFMVLEKEHQRIFMTVLVLIIIGFGFFVGIQVKHINGKEEAQALIINTTSEEEKIEEEEGAACVIVYVSGAVKSLRVFMN